MPEPPASLDEFGQAFFQGNCCLKAYLANLFVGHFIRILADFGEMKVVVNALLDKQRHFLTLFFISSSWSAQRSNCGPCRAHKDKTKVTLEDNELRFSGMALLPVDFVYVQYRSVQFKLGRLDFRWHALPLTHSMSSRPRTKGCEALCEFRANRVKRQNMRIYVLELVRLGRQRR